MASSHHSLEPLQAALRDLFAWIRSERVPGMVIGGAAVALLGRPRITRDVDAVIWLSEDRWEQFLAAGARFGLSPRIKRALEFAAQHRVLLLNHGPSGIDVDVSCGGTAFEDEAIRRASTRRHAGLSIPIPTPEDLIIMKAVAHRDRDLADIEGILDVHPKVDRRRIRRWVREFASVLEMPEILTDLERLFAHRRKRRW